MNNTKLDCSLNDTTLLRNFILENPDLPLLIFCGEDSWHDEYPYEQANVTKVGIQELTFYNNYWRDKEDFEEELANDLSDEEEYVEFSDKEYDQMIKQKVDNAEFVKAIVIYVG